MYRPKTIKCSIVCNHALRPRSIFNHIGKVIVKCAQDGMRILTEVHNLANFEGFPPSTHEIFCGASLLLEREEGKPYPVVFVGYQGMYVYV